MNGREIQRASGESGIYRRQRLEKRKSDREREREGREKV